MTLDTAPRSTAWAWCAGAALSQFVAVLIALSVWMSTEFANDFENGTYTADAASSSVTATVLSIVGIFCALAAVFRPKAGPLACVAGGLLLFSGCAVGLLALPLFGHYS